MLFTIISVLFVTNAGAALLAARDFNFDEDIISIEMQELLFENGIETEMYTVFARSTNGTAENEVGEKIYYYETFWC